MRKRPLFMLACVFLAGIVFVRYSFFRIGIIGCITFLAGQEMYYGIGYRRFKKMAGRMLLLLSAFATGCVHMISCDAFSSRYLSQIEDGMSAIVWGEIYKSEMITASYGESYRYYLKDCQILLKQEVLPCNDILVYTSSDQYQVGEIHKITGQLNTFDAASNFGNFDSRAFYRSQGIDFAMKADSFERLEQKNGGLNQMLQDLRLDILQVYKQAAKEKTAGFLAGMVLGEKKALDKEIKDLFTSGGIAHILAISGLHVSIIGRGFYNCLRKRGIGFGLAGVCGAFLLLSYSYMAGNSMSAIRAVGMMFLFFFAQYLGRSYDMLNALGALVIFLLWSNPLYIEYSGFWFSVMALIGVGVVGDVFSKEVKQLKGLWMSIGINLATLPVVAFCYYEIPIYSSFVNALLLPLLTPAFLLAVIGGMIGLISLPLATILLWPCHWLLLLYESVCKWAKLLPFSSLLTGQIPIGLIIGYYVLLFLGLLLLRYYQSWKVKLSLCVLCYLLLVFPRPQAGEITFLDVGQGDGIYIQTGDDTTYFIDGGSIDVKGVGENRILSFLKARAVGKIDYWFVTHADIDHISGLIELIESGYQIEHLVLADTLEKSEGEKNLLACAMQKKIPIVYMQANDVLRTAHTSLTCIYPNKQVEEIASDRNDRSLVLQLKWKSGTALFTGDISSEVESYLLDHQLVSAVDIYKVAHHGSKYSNSAAFLASVSPESAIISCGENNIYGHPHPDVIKRLQEEGCRVYATPSCGGITVYLDDKRKMHCYKQPLFHR